VPSVSSPRAFAWQRLDRQRLVCVANSSVAWSRPRLEEYCNRRGIPTASIIDLPLGSSTVWNPGSNAAIAPVVAQLAAFMTARRARGLILGPGLPAMVLVTGVVTSTFSAIGGGSGVPPLHTLFAGAYSFATLLAAGGGTLVTFDGTSGAWQWWVSNGVSHQVIWSSLIWLNVGSSDTALAPQLTLNDDGVLSATFTPSTAATQLLYSGSPRQVPVGRVGYTSWTGEVISENSTTALQALTSADAGNQLVAQPAPILVMIGNTSGNNGLVYAVLLSMMRKWGYHANYVYRQAPVSPQETYAPAAGAVATETAFETTTNGLPYYYLAGFAENDDTAQTGGVGFNTVAGTNGAVAAIGGASFGFYWALRQLQRGCAAAEVDQTHRTAVAMTSHWVIDYLLLAGMSLMEAVYFSGNIAGPLACGDPLFAPFHFAAGPKPDALTQPGSGAPGTERRAERERSYRR
jgi:hypothetical protein